MDGHDLAKYAASARPGLKIVLMSAHSDRELSGGIIDHNVAAFLRKPHRKAELVKTLRRVLALNS
jgi:DNA-binding NarL/FixJ family response regulator